MNTAMMPYSDKKESFLFWGQKLDKLEKHFNSDAGCKADEKLQIHLSIQKE